MLDLLEEVCNGEQRQENKVCLSLQALFHDGIKRFDDAGSLLNVAVFDYGRDAGDLLLHDDDVASRLEKQLSLSNQNMTANTHAIYVAGQFNATDKVTW